MVLCEQSQLASRIQVILLNDKSYTDGVSLGYMLPTGGHPVYKNRSQMMRSGSAIRVPCSKAAAMTEVNLLIFPLVIRRPTVCASQAILRIRAHACICILA